MEQPSRPVDGSERQQHHHQPGHHPGRDEVLDLDQTLTEVTNVTLEEREEDTTTRARDNKGEKDKKGTGKRV